MNALSLPLSVFLNGSNECRWLSAFAVWATGEAREPSDFRDRKSVRRKAKKGSSIDCHVTPGKTFKIPPKLCISSLSSHCNWVSHIRRIRLEFQSARWRGPHLMSPLFFFNIELITVRTRNTYKYENQSAEMSNPELTHGFRCLKKELWLHHLSHMMLSPWPVHYPNLNRRRLYFSDE